MPVIMDDWLVPVFFDQSIVIDILATPVLAYLQFVPMLLHV